MYHLKMTAIDYAKNVNREWSCELSDDLFSNVLLENHWGRVGGNGRSKKQSFETYEEALKHIKMLRSRRKSLVKRVGVPYTTVLDELKPLEDDCSR